VVVHIEGDKTAKVEGATVTLSLPQSIEQQTDKSGTAFIVYPSVLDGKNIDLNVTKAGYRPRQPETTTLKNGSTVYLALTPRAPFPDGGGGYLHDIEKYLQDMKNKFSLWRGLGLGRDIALEEIYVSHRLENGQEEILSDDRLLGLLTNTSLNKQNILIKGQAGSGKTTLLKLWVLKLAKLALEANFQGWIPVYVSLGRVGELCGNDPDWHGSVVEIAAGEFTDINDKVSPSLIEALTKIVNTGNAIILLDAVDEVDEVTRPNVLRWLERMQQASHCPIVVTSRPSSSVDNMMSFQVFNIKPFKFNQIQSFIDKWFKYFSTNAQKMKILLEKSAQLVLLAGNPLFLTMMCVTYENDQFIQSYTEGELLEKFVWILLRDWDIDNGGRREHARPSNDATVELHVLESVSVQFFGQVEIKEDELMDFVQKTLKKYDSTLDAQSLIQGIQSVSGILMSERGGKFRFCHPIFPDFFYAHHLLQEVKSGRLNWQDWTRETGEQEKYRNVDVLFKGLLRQLKTSV
jgi:NACHT domain